MQQPETNSIHNATASNESSTENTPHSSKASEFSHLARPVMSEAEGEAIILDSVKISEANAERHRLSSPMRISRIAVPSAEAIREMRLSDQEREDRNRITKLIEACGVPERYRKASLSQAMAYVPADKHSPRYAAAVKRIEEFATTRKTGGIWKAWR